MDSIYEQYESYVKTILCSGELGPFKSNENYHYMLEHVSAEFGREYLHLLDSTPIPLEMIKGFCEANDEVGSPIKTQYPLIGAVSPTSLRYLYHAHLLLSHFKTFSNTISIVEVGGGYGGLCAAVSWVAPLYSMTITSYSIIDLPTILELQKRYLNPWTLRFPVSFHSAFEYGASIEGGNHFLVSNYCFSELSNQNQKRYICELFPKIVHGFIAWNMCNVYDLGFDTQSTEPENPKTGELNWYVRF
jgi:hypothetical protein